jgi:hypothetical protein
MQRDVVALLDDFEGDPLDAPPSLPPPFGSTRRSDSDDADPTEGKPRVLGERLGVASHVGDCRQRRNHATPPIGGGSVRSIFPRSMLRPPAKANGREDLETEGWTVEIADIEEHP